MEDQGDRGSINFSSITFSSIHQIFLHQIAHPSTFPTSNEENNKKSSIKMTSITSNEEKGFSVILNFARLPLKVLYQRGGYLLQCSKIISNFQNEPPVPP